MALCTEQGIAQLLAFGRVLRGWALAARQQGEDGIVHSSLKPRCIGCSNCVLACPFGVPHYVAQIDQMMKCDMCYDRTSIGKRPMCATVCPSQALSFTTLEEIERTRHGVPVNTWRFGNEVVHRRVFVMRPSRQSTVQVDHVGRQGSTPPAHDDVAALLEGI